jgi:hypothetical protein
MKSQQGEYDAKRKREQLEAAAEAVASAPAKKQKLVRVPELQLATQ